MRKDDETPAYVQTEPSNRHTVTIFYATGWSRPELHYTTNLDYGKRHTISLALIMSPNTHTGERTLKEEERDTVYEVRRSHILRTQGFS